jgi:hypothetical protein
LTDESKPNETQRQDATTTESTTTTEDAATPETDEDSPLDDLIESITEIPHVLFRKWWGNKDE